MIEPLGREQRRAGGSRFLYEPFEARNAAHSEIFERVVEERWRALEQRLGGIEGRLERLDRRLWLAVFAVAGAILTQAAQQILVQAG